MKIIRELKNTETITAPADVLKFVKEFVKEDREYFVVIGLDSKNRPMYREICNIGTLNTAVVDVRTVFRRAISSSVNSIILVHNHPSGVCEPSSADIDTLKKLYSAGELLNIKVLDSLIIGSEGHYSFNNERLWYE